MVRRKVGLLGAGATVRTLKSREILVGGCTFVIASAIALGCGKQGATDEGEFRRQEQALEQLEQPGGPSNAEPSSPNTARTAKPAVESDGPTSTAVTVVWHEQDDAKAGTEFSVVVTNTSSDTQSVEILLTGATPSNQIVEQSFSKLVLASNEKRLVSINVDDLPVQSTVHASALSVAARYGKYGAEGSNPPLLAFTEPLMITFESNFKTATARKMGEQIRVDSNVADTAAHLLARGEVLIKQPGSVTFAKAAGENPESGQGPTLILSQVDAHLDLEEDVQHFPDTEVIKGN